MNRHYYIILASFVLFSCIGQHESNTQQVSMQTELTPPAVHQNADTLFLHPSQVSIHWKGTKMKGMGKHEGQIALQNGFVLLEKNRLSGGELTIDMHTISVTDIPAHEPVPRKRLTNHLKSEEFFDVSNYPRASFHISNTTYLTADSLEITGILEIKHIAKPIQFYAIHQGDSLSTTFTFNRFDWKIAYEGSWANKTLVDKDIELRISLSLN